MAAESRRYLLLLTSAADLFSRLAACRRRLPRTVHCRAADCLPVGLLLVWISTESPLGRIFRILLQAHMTQHLLLMMVAPPLILLGQPMLPLLHGSSSAHL